MKSKIYSDYIVYSIYYYFYEHREGPDRCPMCAGNLSRCEIEPSRALRDDTARAEESEYYPNGAVTYLHTCNECPWWCIRENYVFIEPRSLHQVSHDYLIFALPEMDPSRGANDLPEGSPPWHKALDDPDLYDDDVLRRLPKELAVFLYKQPGSSESVPVSRQVIKDVSQQDRFLRKTKDLIAKKQRKKPHKTEPMRLQPGDQVQITDHEKVNCQIIATRGSTGTVLSFETYQEAMYKRYGSKEKEWASYLAGEKRSWLLDHFPQATKQIEAGTHYPVRLETVVPPLKEEIAFWSELFARTLVYCEVGEVKLLSVDCLKTDDDKPGRFTMTENPELDQFNQHFGFLVQEYGFQVEQQDLPAAIVFTASSANCVLRISIPKPNHPTGFATISIRPVGAVAQELTRKDDLPQIDIAQIVRCYEPDLEQREWWDSRESRQPLPVLAMYVKKYCQPMLQGDFSQWPFVQKRLRELFEERRKAWLENYREEGYRIIEEHGRYGLTHNRIPVLKPVYSSVEVINQDSHEYTLDHYQDDPSVTDVGEYNFPIVIADGKYGLLHGSEFRLGLDYARIIKLTFCHYLCQREDGTLVLYDTQHLSEPRVTFTMSADLTLENLLQTLRLDHLRVYTELMDLIHMEGDKYISEYRHYGGSQETEGRYIHHFAIAAVEAVLTNDFRVSSVWKITKI